MISAFNFETRQAQMEFTGEIVPFHFMSGDKVVETQEEADRVMVGPYNDWNSEEGKFNKKFVEVMLSDISLMPEDELPN